MDFLAPYKLVTKSREAGGPLACFFLSYQGIVFCGERLDFLTMVEDVCKSGMNIGNGQLGKGCDDFFGGFTAKIVPDMNISNADARTLNTGLAAAFVRLSFDMLIKRGSVHISIIALCAALGEQKIEKRRLGTRRTYCGWPVVGRYEPVLVCTASRRCWKVACRAF